MTPRPGEPPAADAGGAAGPADPTHLQTLDRVVDEFGSAALHDPVALRAALRSIGGTTATAADLLAAVAGSGVVRDVRSAGASGVAVDAATRTLQAGTGPAAELSGEEVRRAVAAFAAAGGARERGDQARISWDAADGTTAPATAVRSRRRPALLVAILLVVLAAGAAAAFAAGLVPGPAAPAAADRFAVEQVAQRYRALGATLLDGAASCARDVPQPGEVEAVSCAFDGWTMHLTSYDSASRLIEERERPLVEAPSSLRSTRAVTSDAAFALVETGAGSTIYWDTTRPRPASARIDSGGPGLLDLVARYDSRGVTTVDRPEPPGPAFASGELWLFAAQTLGVDDASCAPAPRADPAGAAAVDAVRCTLPDGGVVDMVQVGSYEQLLARRTVAASEDGKVPGTLRGVGGWKLEEETDNRGQFAEYVGLDDGDAHIYWDDERTRCVALLSHPDLGQDELLRSWRD
jgi:hypothetical protein